MMLCWSTGHTEAGQVTELFSFNPQECVGRSKNKYSSVLLTTIDKYVNGRKGSKRGPEWEQLMYDYELLGIWWKMTTQHTLLV